MKWQSYKLKEVGEVVTGNTPPTTQREYYGTQYKFIKPTDMREGQRYVPITEEYYSELAYQKYCKSLLPVNTPCVVTIGSLGKKMCLTDEPSFTNQAVNAVIPNENFDGEFLYYCLRTRLPYVKQLDSGTTSGRENVSKSSFSNIVIEAPSLAIQKRIASILSAYDNLIENNNKRIKILEQMAENLYKEWFVRFRFPGHESTPFENGIPKDWMIKRVDELAKIKAGGDRPDICEDEITDNCKVPVYSNGIENEGLYGFTDVAEINKASVTISARGTIGYVCLRRIPFVPIVRLLSVTPNTSEISVYYLYYLLKNDAIIGNGTSQQQITVPMLGRKKILVPENSLVKSFTAKVESIWNEIDLLKNSTANLIKQRDLLLPRLMSGKLAV